jgi:sigma-B regulation protein RsbU (phosphoserine phosphatase)
MPEKVFIVLLVLYTALASLIASNGYLTFLRVILILLGIWVLIRLARGGVRRALWRLRNRLMMTYLFIAVVPILLILVFAGLGAYALSSQLAVYLVSSELDRRIGELNWVAHGIADANPRDRQRIMSERAEALTHGFIEPAITLRQGDSVIAWPDANGNHDSPPTRADVNGILVRGGRFYAWAHVVKGDADITVTAPLTRAYLSGLVPGLGDVALFIFSTDPRASQVAEAHEPSANQLGPPQNFLDADLRGGSFMPFVYWDAVDNPQGQRDRVLISVETRPSALLGTIFSAKVADIQQIIPVALFGVAILFLLVEVSSLVVGVSLARTITAAVHQLYSGTQRVMQSDFSNRIKVSKSRDQLATLSASFNTMTENLERLLAVAKEKERLQSELEIAREVQEQLYPKEIPSMKTVRLTAFWQSARVV